MSQKVTPEEIVIIEIDEPTEGEKTYITYMNKMKNSKRTCIAAFAVIMTGVAVIAYKKLAVPTQDDSEETPEA